MAAALASSKQIMERSGLFMYVPKDLPKKPDALWMFDVDGTIITSSDGSKISGRSFELLGDVYSVFDGIIQSGAAVALVSNQALWDFATQDKFAQLRVLFPNVIQAVATDHGSPFRKPSAQIYKEIQKLFDVAPEVKYMIGDAVGPEADWPPYKWSDSDQRFAEACGAYFYEARSIFPSVPPPEPNRGYQELVIMVGNPGSGKSTTCLSLEAEGYVRVCQDELGTKAKVIRQGHAAWLQGKSVIVDGTNPSSEKRLEFIREITAFRDKFDKKPIVRIIWLIRDGRPFNGERPQPVPEVAYRVYTKNFNRPTVQELIDLGLSVDSYVEMIY